MTTPATSDTYASGETPGSSTASVTLHPKRRISAEAHAPTTPLRVDPCEAASPAPIDRQNDRVDLFGIQIDRVTREQSVSRILHWIDEGPAPQGARYVFTPNVDHIVRLQSNETLRAAYGDASLVVADGWPIVRASKWLGKPLPERVAGSDLVPRLFSSAASRGGLRVFLLGGMPGVPERAAAHIRAGWKSVEIVGLCSPEYGFEKRPEECERICRMVSEASPDLLIVGFGAPKQELWLHAHHKRLRAGAVIAAGATIDFLAGEQTRAPQWVQSIGMEWFYRAASNPKRLGMRYARDLVHFPRICLREARKLRR